MKPATVFIIAKYSFPNDTRLFQQVRALVRDDIPGVVLCLREKGQPLEEQCGSVVIVRLMKKRPKEGFIEYLRSTGMFGIRAFLSLCSRATRCDCRVVVVHTLPEFLVFIGLLHKIMGAALILDGRDLSYDLLSSRWHGGFIKPVHFVARIVERLCTAVCDHVITASNGFKRSLVERGTPAFKITVLANTADASIFRFDGARRFDRIEKNARLLYHGTVSERFGILIAVEAMAQVVRAVPGSTLRIHGTYDPRYRQLLETRITELGMRDAVLLYEVQPLETIAMIINETDLGVVPYMSDRFMNLALSTKMFEYVASGLPVVASRLASSEELFGEDCLFYTAPGDPRILAEVIVRALRSPVEREQRRIKAHAAFQAFSGDVVAQEYLYLIKSHLPDRKNDDIARRRAYIVKSHLPDRKKGAVAQRYTDVIKRHRPDRKNAA